MSRLVTKEAICAYLGEISATTYDNWARRGIVPGPVPGTNRYDIRAHDRCLDRASGLTAPTQPAKLSPLDEWEKSHAA